MITYVKKLRNFLKKKIKYLCFFYLLIIVYLLNPQDCYFINHTIPFNCYVKTIEDKDKVLNECAGNIGNTYIMYCLQKILFGKVLTSDDCSGISNLFCAELCKINT